MGLIAARIIAFLIASSTITAAAIAQSPPCKTKCGGIDIPYPFGIGEGCYAKEYGDFNVNCTQNSRAFLGNTGNEILSISLNGELRIKAAIGHQCFTPAGANDTYQPAVFLGNRTFTFSHTKNRLFVVGCDTNPWIWDREGTRYSGGCMSYCETADSLKDLDKNDSCSGLGCCGVSIPRGIRRYITGIQSYYRYRNSMSFNRCGYIFLAERDQYKFSIADLTHDGKVSRLILPVVIDWSIGSQSCENAKNGSIVPYACRSANSECIKSNNEIGYFCGCSKGYQGNPYLAGGCRDVDECAQTLSVCPSNARCSNNVGNYSCICPKGYQLTSESPQECRPRNDAVSLGLKLGLGFGGGLLLLLCAGVLTSWGYQRRKLRKHAEEVAEFKKRMFKQNGGPLLQQQISSQPGNVFKIFTEEELSKATENFSDENVIGKGGHGVVYLGKLEDNTAIAVKRSKFMDERESIEFAREMAILSQINHVNVVKILGCCMEVEVPMLVYEFVSGGTLFQLLHGRREKMPVSLGFILRIAGEVADALSYLHSYASPPVLHKDVKTSNVLLDENMRAKISDFGASSFAPLDEEEIATVVQGTCGYLDPEYLQTYQFSEKSDVYSFGVVLVELLTRRKPFQLKGADDSMGLAMRFVSSLEEGKLETILDPQIMEEGNTEVLTRISVLAGRCLNLKGKDRPSMREVSMSLHMLGPIQEHPWVPNETEDETRRLLNGDQPKSSDSTIVCGSFVVTNRDTLVEIDAGR